MENYARADNMQSHGCRLKKVYQKWSEILAVNYNFIIFKGQVRLIKDMVITSKFLPSLANNRKFILNMRGKGRFQAKGQLIQIFHYKITGGIIE
jgi:hypothetical protein